ncbi:MAG: molybdopterin-dependent oxidoreductase [bacterium]
MSERHIIDLTVNGDKRTVTVAPSTRLTEVLREQLGLTGTKSGCGVGDCGLCTVLLDGEPVNSCLLLALEAVGHDIVTIEGLAADGELHPLQRAFMEEGGLQCGFCTPAMVLVGKALIDRNPDPTDEEIREALAGTLCRCTGYTKIIEAIKHWKDYAKPRDKRPPGQDEHVVVGARLPRKDALEKVTGRAQYADDIRLPNMIFGKILTSPLAHARIVGIDTSKAEALPGVKAVLTGRDVTDTLYGISPARYDENVLAKEKVCHVGDEVAAVAAVDEATCNEALRLIDVEYEELPAVFNAFDAMEEGAPVILERYKNNINTRVDWSFGDVEKGFDEADLVLEGSYEGNRTYQSPMEPHCAVSEWDGNGHLTVYTSTQVVHYVRHQLARLLDVPEGDIRVVGTHCGGGFGGKAGLNPLEILSALLARETGRPVKMRYTRSEMFHHNRGRHKQYIELKMGMKTDGSITAVKQKCVLDGGAYSSFGVVAVYYAGAMVPTLYKLPNYKYDGFRVNTNLPACGAMRGHGCPHPRFAFESLLDDLAEGLGLDPIDVRLKNAMDPNTQTVNSLDVGSCELKACLDRVRERSGWKEKHGKLPFGKGIGIGCGGFVSGAGYPIYRSNFPHSNATIKVSEDGHTAILHSGETDIGQGSMTVLAQIAAEALGITFDRIKVVIADTDATPLGLGSYSSRVTLMGGNAAKMAADDIRGQMLDVASKMLEVPADRLAARENRVFCVDDEGKALAWHEVAAKCFAEKGPLVGRGHYSPAEGAIAMMLGETLLENVAFDEAGRLLNPNLHDYLLPTAKDVPPIDSGAVDSYEPRGPFGAKEVGEGATLPVIGAIANAIYDAVGVRVTSLPITAEKVLAGLQEKAEAGK